MAGVVLLIPPLFLLLVLLLPVVLVRIQSHVTVENAEALYRDAETLMPNPNVSGVRSEDWPPTIRALHPMLVGKDAPHTLFILISAGGMTEISHGYLISDDPAEVKAFSHEEGIVKVIPSNHPRIFGYVGVSNNR